MKRVLLSLGLVGLGVLMGIGLPRFRSDTTATPPADTSSTRADPMPTESPVEPVAPDRTADQEQRTHKEALLAALLAMQARGLGQPGPSPVPSEAGGEAQRLLDERIAQGATGSSIAAELRKGVQGVVKSGQLGSSTLREVKCAGHLCRIDLVDATRAASEAGTEQLIRAMGKSIGGFLALDGPEGEKVIYLGKSHEDLQVTKAPNGAVPAAL